MVKHYLMMEQYVSCEISVNGFITIHMGAFVVSIQIGRSDREFGLVHIEFKEFFVTQFYQVHIIELSVF